MRAVALTIAGSDPSGGAGLQADLKTFHQFGVYGEAVVTLLTVQNTRAVTRVEVFGANLVAEQVAAVLGDLPPLAIKTGALGDESIVRQVAALAPTFRCPLVVDPVLVSKHGARLMSVAGERALQDELFRHAVLVTPNLPEAALLSGQSVETEAGLRRAAEIMRASGCAAVLIKGGHSLGDPTDFLLDADGWTSFAGHRIDTRHTHGTGCTYSAAITACLALGHGLREAVRISHAFVQRAIATAPGFGAGHGPVNHFAPVPET